MITVQVEDTPKEYDADTLYVVKFPDDIEPWVICFLCPCGCESISYINLIKDDDPWWDLEQHEDGTISLTPSVHRIRGCESHFFIKKSEIQWC